jgi:exo-1,4-beta-D-glucosaminidase
MIWHLYDYYLRPGGSYFGVKHACEPLHVQYSYDDRSIVVVNSYYRRFAGLKVTAKVYDLDMNEKFSKQVMADIGEDSSTRVFTVPEMEGLHGTYFLDLRIDDGGALASRNFYWLSTETETIDWANEPPSGVWTPTKTFADYTALNSLSPVDLDVAVQKKTVGEQDTMTVTLHNPGRSLAFGIRLKVKRLGRIGNGWYWEGPLDDEVLPSLWEDNYIALLPGEARQLTATYNVKDAKKNATGVEVSGWNVKMKEVRP